MTSTPVEPTRPPRLGAFKARRRRREPPPPPPPEPPPEDPSKRWQIDFGFAFEFDFDKVKSDRDAKQLGELHISEAIRGVIADRLRSHGLNVEVGPPDALFRHGSVQTIGLVRMLAEFRDVPGIAEHLTNAEWFWTELQIALGTPLGRDIAIRRRVSRLLSALPYEYARPRDPKWISAEEAFGIQIADTPVDKGSGNPFQFDFSDQLGAFAKIAIAVLLLSLPYACGRYQSHLDNQQAQELAAAISSAKSDVFVVQNANDEYIGCTTAPRRPVAPPPRIAPASVLRTCPPHSPGVSNRATSEPR